MRILSKENLQEMLARYASVHESPPLRGLIVLRNGERRRDFHKALAPYIQNGTYGLVRHGQVLSFRNHNLIRIALLANRFSRMFDDILFDESIEDLEALYHIDRCEYYKDDFGEFDTSEDVMQFMIGGADGNA